MPATATKAPPGPAGETAKKSVDTGKVAEEGVNGASKKTRRSWRKMLLAAIKKSQTPVQRITALRRQRLVTGMYVHGWGSLNRHSSTVGARPAARWVGVPDPLPYFADPPPEAARAVPLQRTTSHPGTSHPGTSMPLPSEPA
ncbi:hypothetical protein GGTG_12272 [Gaeumannomyces tritici R3-111a-1]|uniref:Uncharacterized protein n=1 Tax=Gaeumannomyces tritici (strain R3-111a-1) TaxID=644352 RepID=J3PFJ7_GAET3|nr:hypothetical protein GGTG_12272 [Gaeumannomyces tritici R3-111a-1]EJT70099.1 hypothetical protein GGTG_12272 [Gaeumannomyces tritici R3-111a-1]